MQTIVFARHDVTAVIVSHDGERWVGRVLDALAAQDRPIQRVVAIDTGSRDRTVEILHERLGEGRVLTRPRDVGFGQAVAFGVGAVYGVEPPPKVTGHPDEPVDWIWLLHDDCEPAADALNYLLALVDGDPEVAVVGPKVLGWYQSRELLEVGLTIASNGRRETGLDTGEEDQGQHDGKRGVLAVGSAGMLIRRDVWDALGGFDRNLAFMRDDIDFCWRVNAAGWRVVINTDAVVYHAEAVARGRRRVAGRVRRPHYLDRAHAFYVLLANLRLAKVPLALIRLVGGSLGKTFGYLVAKLPDYAADEMLALGSVIGRTPAIATARLRRRRTRVVKPATLRPLFPARWSQLRHLVDSIAERLPNSPLGTGSARGAVAAESGPVSEDAEDLDGNDLPISRRIARQPLVVLMVILVGLTLVAGRELIGSGRLMGGALLPAPNGARELWELYLASWHAVGVGSDSSATPYIGALAGLSSVLLGSPTHAVDLLLLGAVPMSGLTAYLAVRKVVNSRLLRLWAAAAYALLPAVTGAVAAGRLGTAVGAILLPVAGLGAIRTLGLDGKPGTWRAAWTTGLLLAVITAFVPVAWLIAAVLGLAAVASRAARTGAALRIGATLITPVFVLLPWSLDLLRQPSLIFLEAGLPGPDLSDTRVDAIELLLLHPGGPGMYPVWISAGVLAAGFAALLRNERRGIVAGGWAVALAGLVVGLVTSRVHVTGPTLASAVPAWPGFATVVMGAGLLLAALIGAEGARDRIAAKNFGWQQPLSVGVSVLAILAPVVAGLWWMWSGAGGPMQRRDPVVLPAFVAAEGESTDRPRALVLQMRDEGQLSYSLVRDIGPQLGDAETAPRNGTFDGLDQIVREVASGHGADQVDRLADYAIRYVLVTAPLEPTLIQALDGVPGMTRVSVNEQSGLWRLDVPSARVRILPPPEDEAQTDKEALAAALALPVPSTEVDASAAIPSGPAGRTLVLAENADPGWQAQLDGSPLVPVTYDGWAQAFELPEGGGQLELGHENRSRDRWLAVQLLAIAVVFVLALPAGRRVELASDVDEGVELERRRVRGAQPDSADRELDLDYAGLSAVGALGTQLGGQHLGEIDGPGAGAPPPHDDPWAAEPPPYEQVPYEQVPYEQVPYEQVPYEQPQYAPVPNERSPEPRPHETYFQPASAAGHDTLAGSYEVVHDEPYVDEPLGPPDHGQLPPYADHPDHPGDGYPGDYGQAWQPPPYADGYADRHTDGYADPYADQYPPPPHQSPNAPEEEPWPRDPYADQRHVDEPDPYPDQYRDSGGEDRPRGRHRGSR